MAEYIEREAALALLKNDREVCADSKEELKYIRADIRSIPAADVRPVEKCKWENLVRVGFAGWKGCRDTRYKCPLCTKYVRNDEKYCHKCEQALMFPIIGHTPYVPGKRQEVIISWPDEPPKEE